MKSNMVPLEPSRFEYKLNDRSGEQLIQSAGRSNRQLKEKLKLVINSMEL